MKNRSKKKIRHLSIRTTDSQMNWLNNNHAKLGHKERSPLVRQLLSYAISEFEGNKTSLNAELFGHTYIQLDRISAKVSDINVKLAANSNDAQYIGELERAFNEIHQELKSIRKKIS